MISVQRAGNAVYPEARLAEENWLAKQLINTIGRAWRRREVRLSALEGIVPLVDRQAVGVANLSDSALQNAAAECRAALSGAAFADEAVARVFALVREAARRTLGMTHYDVQLIGGYALLAGVLAEMDTGEGKTLTATLAASAAALGGYPVHIITANDYLASRDAQEMRPVYAMLGLSVSAIEHDMDRPARRAAYGSAVTYCSNKEITFDYLRDRIALGRERNPGRLQLERLHRSSARIDQVVLRGLHFAIVDEADSVLIDEARTPLIISRERPADAHGQIWPEALDVAAQLVDGDDYRLDLDERRALLTPVGEARLADLCAGISGIWSGRNRARELVVKALTALYLFNRDEHYVVRDGQVQIVDEYTGRLMPDRSWEGGLHQLIEAKEDCEITGEKETLARMSYQRFFRRYLHLSGMTGTAREVAPEFWSVYRLAVIRIPTNRPIRRTAMPSRVFTTATQKWDAVVDSALQKIADDRAVLIGTRSVADSEHLSAQLTKSGVSHQVLNAMQDDHEAEIVSCAGQAGCITVATNMAGRGTDIRLGPGVAEKGGLHVICTQPHDALRIDRQLFGRCGRQGDRGSYERLVSLEDELPETYLPDGLRESCRLLINKGLIGSRLVSIRLVELAQRKAQARNSRIRRSLLKMDDKLDAAMAFAGRSE